MSAPVRKILLAVLAAAALCFVVLLALIAVPVSGRVAYRVARVTAAQISRAAIGDAFAQTRLEFKPVPEESAQAFERRAPASRTKGVTDGHAGVATTPPTPLTPATTEVEPVPPEPPTPSSTGNIVQIGSDIHIEKGQVVDGDVLSIGGDIRVDGHVRGNVSATRGDITLGSTARVDRDVLCIGGTLHEEPGAYVGGQRVTGLEGRERLRERLRGGDHEIDLGEETTQRRGAAVARGLIYMLMWLGVTWIIAHFAPTRTGTALRSLENEPGMALGYGFALVLLLVPSIVALAFVVALLCITLVGIPVALGALIAYAGLLVILGGWGVVVGYAALGARFARGSGRPGGSLTASAILGALVIHGLLIMGNLLHLIPFMGGFGTLVRVLGIVGYSVLVLLGVGALLRSKFGQGPAGRWWPPQHLFGSLGGQAAAG
ncbi:MAG TPA: polymer-forming cytoskeletal protein, partial [Dongiaceae bacterium]|nr:polymer-forming cytoskeletal protein [Dongiaceae bacterium]